MFNYAFSLRPYDATLNRKCLADIWRHTSVASASKLFGAGIGQGHLSEARVRGGPRITRGPGAASQHYAMQIFWRNPLVFSYIVYTKVASSPNLCTPTGAKLVLKFVNLQANIPLQIKVADSLCIIVRPLRQRKKAKKCKKEMQCKREKHRPLGKLY
jgi:hypothetical protein